VGPRGEKGLALSETQILSPPKMERKDLSRGVPPSDNPEWLSEWRGLRSGKKLGKSNEDKKICNKLSSGRRDKWPTSNSLGKKKKRQTSHHNGA